MPPGPRPTPSDEFDVAAAMAAHLTFAPAVHSAQMNIQVHGGIGFTWENDPHLFLRRALVLNALLGSPDDAEDVTAHGSVTGTTRDASLDLPPEAEAIRAEVRAEAQRIGSAARRGATQGTRGVRALGAPLADAVGSRRRCRRADRHR